MSRSGNSTWKARLWGLTRPGMKLNIQFKVFKGSERTIFLGYFNDSPVLDTKKNNNKKEF